MSRRRALPGASAFLIRVCGTMLAIVPHMRVSEASVYLGVSDDTVRRWIDRGLLGSTTDTSGRKVVDGYEVAMVAREHSTPPALPGGMKSSARNRFVGLVTDLQVDAVMAQVELQCGPFRVVSLMSSEAVRDLGLERGSVAVAVIKSTNVVIEAEA